MMTDQTGLVTIRSNHPVVTTIDRLAAVAEGKGLRIFARIDHAAGAATLDLPLRPTQLLLFGHPRGGTPLMQDRQTAGLDLPLRAVAWEDADGAVWLTWNDPAWLATRHGLTEASAAAVAAMTETLGALGAAAAR